MAQLIPPTPLNAPMTSDVWNRWLETVRQTINNSAVGVVWANINFAGSNLSDLAVREHNTLQSLQGGSAGEYFHLTAAQYAALTSGAHNSLSGLQGGTTAQYYHLTTVQHTRATSVISAAIDPTTTEIGASEWAIYKNTTLGDVKLWTNDAGTMKSVLFV